MSRVYVKVLILLVVCLLLIVVVNSKIEAQGVSSKVIVYVHDAVNGAVGILNGLYVRLSESIAGEDAVIDVIKVEQRFGYTHIVLAAPTTTVIRSGPGFLHYVNINTATALGVITCYDNTVAAGNVILIITQPATLLMSQNSLEYNISFSVGLTCVTSGAAQDITVVSR